QRIGPEPDLPAKSGRFRLGGDLDALSGHVVFPAVIGTAQSALLVAAEPERHAAMGAELVDQPEPPLRVTEREQALREQLHADWRTVVVRELFGQQRRNPVAAEQPAHRRAGTGQREQVILFFPEQLPTIATLKSQP